MSKNACYVLLAAGILAVGYSYYNSTQVTPNATIAQYSTPLYVLGGLAIGAAAIKLNYLGAVGLTPAAATK